MFCEVNLLEKYTVTKLIFSFEFVNIVYLAKGSNNTTSFLSNFSHKIRTNLLYICKKHEHN